MTGITLTWANKFRELCEDETLTVYDIIGHFHAYIKKKEDELNFNTMEREETESKESENEDQFARDELSWG